MENNKGFKCECGGELQLVKVIDGFFTYGIDEEGRFSWENKEFHGDTWLNLQCTVCNKEYECELDDEVEEKVNIIK